MESTPMVEANQDIDTVKSALNLAEMVAFGCGPLGVVAGSLVGLLSVVFGALEPKDSAPDLPKAIDELVEQDFANDHVKTDLATILTYTGWLHDQFSTDQANDPHWKAHQGSWDQLKSYVDGTVDPNSPLIQAIGNLRNGTYTSNPSFQILGLPAFMLGAAFHLEMLRAQLLFSTDATTFRSPLAYEIATTASDYHDYVSGVAGDIDALAAKRLGGIGGVVEAGVVDYEVNGLESVMTEHSHYVYVTDTEFATTPIRPVIDVNRWYAEATSTAPPNVVLCRFADDVNSMPTASDYSDMSTARSAYLTGVSSDLEIFYNYSATRKADITSFLTAVEKVQNTFATVAPSK